MVIKTFLRHVVLGAKASAPYVLGGGVIGILAHLFPTVALVLICIFAVASALAIIGTMVVDKGERIFKTPKKIFQESFCHMGLHDFFTDGCDGVWEAINKYDKDEKFDIRITVEIVEQK